MEQVDLIFKAMALAGGSRETLIACLYTGRIPPAAAAPMPRVPAPPLGMRLDEMLGDHVDAALALNQAVHDGAIMIGRGQADSEYQITGWSFRLYPAPTPSAAGLNRGSAFHSCLAMSAQDDVDATYLVSGGRSYRFVQGHATEL